MRVVHLTSAHPRDDVRIFRKQCRSLVSNGYDVSLVVADGKGSGDSSGITVIDIGRQTGRVNRMLRSTRGVLSAAVALKADIYHLHDPELLPAGLRLKLLGKTVVFDSHEDVPRQLLGKPYLGPRTLRVLSAIYEAFERGTCRRLDGVIAATPHIRDRFLSIHANTVDVCNFPLIEELDCAVPWEGKRNEVCYIGGLTSSRGIREIVRASGMFTSGARLNVAGTFSDTAFESEVRSYPEWEKVNYLGFVDRNGVRGVLSRSLAGLVTLHPLVNYLDALPVKMFEYMAAGIPVIASDFPMWRDIVRRHQCGLLVNPLDSNAIASAVDYLVTSPRLAHDMGQRGRSAVLEHYNWAIEEQKLLGFYSRTLHCERPEDGRV